MITNIYIYIGAYIAIVSIIAIIMTVHDKSAAQRGSRRVSERALLFVSVIGGSVAMLAIMRIIRHKTKHMKFMVGIPVIIILQIAAVFFVWRWF